MKKNKDIWWLIIVAIVFLVLAYLRTMKYDVKPNDNITTTKTFRLISSSENTDLEQTLQEFARKNNIKLSIDYAGTIDIMDKLNSKEQYDAVWTSNSIWLYMLDKTVSVKNSKSTSINPVVFGIKKSKAKELGFVDKEVSTKDILTEIQNGKLKFSMSSATQTNTGATAYLGFLTTLAGNPEILKVEDLENEELKENVKSLFSGVTRSSGSEEFLEEMFIKGDYEAVVTYETSIININKKLEEQGREPLYIVYAKDGVSISDSPLAYIDNSDKDKLAIFEKLQAYVLSEEGQQELLKTGRRVWYGGVNPNADKTIFNPNWGIDTTKYLVPVKYPSTAVIKKALALYQSELRKPTHTVFCLDYSGSMSGDGEKQLVSAMKYILTEEEAAKNMLQFSSKDKISVITFNQSIINSWNISDGVQTQQLIENIENEKPTGMTNIYLATTEALNILKTEDVDQYNVSIVLMTDGLSNKGNLYDVRKTYNDIKRDIPIYSIMFGSASASQLDDIAKLSNAKVFDGRTNLLEAFKKVRSYN